MFLVSCWNNNSNYFSWTFPSLVPSGTALQGPWKNLWRYWALHPDAVPMAYCLSDHPLRTCPQHSFNLGLRTTGTIRYNQVVSSRAYRNLTYLFKILSVSSRFRNHAGFRASSNTICVPWLVHICTDEWSNQSATLNPLTSTQCV